MGSRPTGIADVSSGGAPATFASSGTGGVTAALTGGAGRPAMTAIL